MRGARFKMSPCPAVFAASLCLAVFAAGADVALTATDVGGTSSFNAPLHWSDGLAPHADADYWVTNGLVLRTPEGTANYAFVGRSLTLSNAFINVKGTGIATVGDMRLYAGRIANGIPGTSTLAGTNTVYATPSAPARYSGSNDRVTSITGVFQGAGDLSFDRTEGETPGGFFCELRGDNSAFTGGMRVIGTNIELRVVHTNGLGGALPAFRADALRLSTGILYVASSMTIQGNRGITLDNGGAVRVTGANVLTLAGPITGNGGLVVKGDGRVELNYPMTYTGDTVVESGTLRLSTGFSMPESNRIIVRNGARTLEGWGFVGNVLLEGGAINPATGTDAGLLTVSNLTFSGGALKFDFARGASSDFVRVTGSLSNALNTPVPVVLTGLVTNECQIYPLLTAPNLGAFTTNNFAVTPTYPGLPEGYLDIRLVGGTNTLCFVQTRTVVQMTATDPSGSTSFTSGGRWSDGNVPDSAKDYLVAGTELRSPESGTTTATFSGHSLTLTSGSFKIKNAGSTVGDLRLRGGTLYQGGGALTAYLDGTASVDAPVSSPFNFEIESTAGTVRRLDIRSQFQGAGDLRFRFVASGSTLYYGGAFTLKGTNTAFTGGITVVGARSVELGITDERNLGGNPTAFRADLLRLSQTGVLFAATSLTLDDANRGITLETNGVLRVETNDALTVCTPITGAGILVKRGAGTLVLAGTNSYFGGTSVEAGALELRSPWALGSNSVSFASNTVLRIPRDASALPLGVRLGGVTPLALADTLRVTPLFGEGSLSKAFDLPLFLLMQSATANTSAITLTNTPAGYRATISTRSVDDGGTSRTQVYIRYRWTGMVMMVE